jgi:FtsH-binding integral membrane protein
MELISILKYIVLFLLIGVSTNIVLKFFVSDRSTLLISGIIALFMSGLFFLMEQILIEEYEGFQDDIPIEKPVEEIPVVSESRRTNYFCFIGKYSS